MGYDNPLRWMYKHLLWPNAGGLEFTFEGRGHRLGGAEGVRVRERALACVADRLYSETVAAGLSQPLDLVGVAGTTVDRHKPEGRGGETVSHKS